MTSGAYVNMGSSVEITSGGYVNIVSGSWVNMLNDITLASGSYVNLGTDVSIASGGYINIVSGAFININSEIVLASGGYVNLGSDISLIGGTEVAIAGDVTLTSGAYMHIGSEVDIASGAYVNIASSTEIDIASGAYVNVTAGNIDIDNAYIQNLQEYSAVNETLILDYGSSSGGSDVTLYTVPGGKILYISSAWLSVSMESTDGGNIFLEANGTPILGIKVDLDSDPDTTHPTQNATYGSPVKVTATNTVALESTANDADAVAGFTGWLEDA